MLLITCVGLTLVCCLLTFITLWRYEAWWVRGWDFPRLQLGFLAVVLLLAELVLLDFSLTWSWISVALLAICIAYQAWWIIPYTRLFPREVKRAVDCDPDNSIAILASNVLTPNRNAAALLELVRQYQPDILVTLETDTWWQIQLDVLREVYPHTLRCPLDNLYGMHVYSKLFLEDAKIQFLVEDDVPSMHALAHLRSGQKVQVHFLHPAPPSPTENDESTERDAELLLVAKSVAEKQIPVIVAGDLNDVAWSSTTRLFRKISGLLDPRVGRGMFNSFHAKYPVIRWPLDHLFHSRHFLLLEMKRLSSIGSDHFPMLIRLAHVPEQGKTQSGIDANNKEREFAHKKVDLVSTSGVHTPGE